MALKTCKECGKEISTGAKKCPSCGKDQRIWFAQHKIITGIIVIFVLGFIGSLAGGDKTSESNNKSTATTNTAAPSSSTSAASSQSNSTTTTTPSASTTKSSSTTANNEISRDTYDKIKNGMTKAEVKAILGEPTSVGESETPGVGKMEMWHYQKGISLKAIDVTILNGEVYSKNWTEL